MKKRNIIKLKYRNTYKLVFKSSEIFLLILGLLINIVYLIIIKKVFYGEKLFLLLILILSNILIFLLLRLRIKKIVYLSNTDFQTNLYNRRYLEEELGLILNNINKNREPLSVAIIDIDNFKYINDTFGHLKGDEAILKISEIFKTQFRKQDIVSRWGGDEFIIVMPNTDKNTSLDFLEKTREKILLLDTDIELSISVGLVTSYKKINIDDLLFEVDTALYKAKQKRNHISLGNIIK